MMKRIKLSESSNQSDLARISYFVYRNIDQLWDLSLEIITCKTEILWHFCENKVNMDEYGDEGRLLNAVRTPGMIAQVRQRVCVWGGEVHSVLIYVGKLGQVCKVRNLVRDVNTHFSGQGMFDRENGINLSDLYTALISPE